VDYALTAFHGHCLQRRAEDIIDRRHVTADGCPGRALLDKQGWRQVSMNVVDDFPDAVKRVPGWSRGKESSKPALQATTNVFVKDDPMGSPGPHHLAEPEVGFYSDAVVGEDSQPDSPDKLGLDAHRNAQRRREVLNGGRRSRLRTLAGGRHDYRSATDMTVLPTVVSRSQTSSGNSNLSQAGHRSDG